jgi:hypothetical protein
MRLAVHRDEQLPKLAWFARIDVEQQVTEVDVGPFVEVDASETPKWVVAGMWTGSYSSGDFHRAEAIFGSGLRLDDDHRAGEHHRRPLRLRA